MKPWQSVGPRNNRAGLRIVSGEGGGRPMTDGEALARPCPVERAPEVGPPPAVASLFAEVSGELRRFVLGVVRDPELAEDVMQSTFVKALEHGHEARVETYRGWLFRVAFHEALA